MAKEGTVSSRARADTSPKRAKEATNGAASPSRRTLSMSWSSHALRGPSASTSPLSRTMTRSQDRSTSLNMCELSRTVVPSARHWSIRERTPSRRVERRGGLVEQQQARVPKQCHG